ncbi:MAG: carbamoyltransferase HypF, partial [Armatimonadetes bacterium]|nr:carbamoyltransferase HypF [Armatimonadota bacterium]
MRGLVQGVGFRPFAWRLAHELGLGGSVLNHSGGVTIEVEGPGERVARFQERLAAELPPPGRVDAVETTALPLTGETAFRIAESEGRGGAVALVLPDVATCPECRREIFDPGDRRWGYAFTNCTHCGPRFSIVADVPYDRANTTMRGFVMCPECRAEYDDPADRRFHAQPNACPECGPNVELAIAEADTLPCGAGEGRGGGLRLGWSRVAYPPPTSPRFAGGGAECVADAAELLRAGGILAVKGLGGYHLACDARNAAAVDRLRARKHRDAKPLAVMVADLDGARELVAVCEHEAELLASPEAPIVLLSRTGDLPVAPTEGGGGARTGDLPVAPTGAAGRLAPAIAPGLTTVGVMLA